MKGLEKNQFLCVQAPLIGPRPAGCSWRRPWTDFAFRRVFENWSRPTALSVRSLQGVGDEASDNAAGLGARLRSSLELGAKPAELASVDHVVVRDSARRGAILRRVQAGVALVGESRSPYPRERCAR